jgi:hypothetical protein
MKGLSPPASLFSFTRRHIKNIDLYQGKVIIGELLRVFRIYVLILIKESARNNGQEHQVLIYCYWTYVVLGHSTVSTFTASKHYFDFF